MQEQRQQVKSVLCARCGRRVPVVVLRLNGVRVYQGEYYDCCREFDAQVSNRAGAKAKTNPLGQVA